MVNINKAPIKAYMFDNNKNMVKIWVKFFNNLINNSSGAGDSYDDLLAYINGLLATDAHLQNQINNLANSLSNAETDIDNLEISVDLINNTLGSMANNFNQSAILGTL